MATGRGDHQCAFGGQLTLDVVERSLFAARWCDSFRRRPWDRVFRSRDRHRVCQGFDRVHRCIYETRKLGGIGRRKHESTPGVLSRERRPETAPDAPHFAVERQFTDEFEAFEVAAGHLVCFRQDAHGDGEVVAATQLGEIRGRQVDHELSPRETRAALS